jgi:zinc protease
MWHTHNYKYKCTAAIACFDFNYLQITLSNALLQHLAYYICSMMLNRTQAPPITHAADFTFTLPPISAVTCTNGLPIYYLNGGIQEVINIEWIFTAGASYASLPIIALTVPALIKNGTATKSSLVINETIEYYGASLKASAGPDFASIQLSCLSKHAGALLPLIFELLTQANYPQDEVNIYKQNTLQRLAINLGKTDFNANRKIDELLFGYEHPYGHYNNASDIDQITPTLLQQYLQQHYTNSNCKIFVAGKFAPSIIDQLQLIFGTAVWNNATAPQLNMPAPQASTQRKALIKLDKSGVQASLRIASPFVNKQHPQFAQLIMLNTLFGGYFGSRLMANIREDKGYTYGIYSYIYNNKYHNAFGISTEVGVAVCEAAINEVYNEMLLLQKEAVDAEELQLVKNYILGGLVADLDGPLQVILRWKNLILNDFTEDRFNTNIATYKSVTAEELQALAQQYLQPDNFYEVQVM